MNQVDGASKGPTVVWRGVLGRWLKVSGVRARAMGFTGDVKGSADDIPRADTRTTG